MTPPQTAHSPSQLRHSSCLEHTCLKLLTSFLVPPSLQPDLDGSIFQDVDLLKTRGTFPLMITSGEITAGNDSVMLLNGKILG